MIINQESSKPHASVIVSVYKDVQALACIFHALAYQTVKNFELIVTEDGEDPLMQDFITQQTHSMRNLKHMTQEDRGFRKTMAVNRAIAESNSDYLIFLDGDCIPHPTFIEMHLRHAEPLRVCVGRRMQLGPTISNRVRSDPSEIKNFWTWGGLMRHSIMLHRDRVKNFEIGCPSAVFHALGSRHDINLIGCNFSSFKKDLETINGYDEDLTGVGGEDCDLGARFGGMGIFTKNIKFQACVHHLWHESRRDNQNLNLERSSKNILNRQFVCVNGIKKFA